MEGQGTFSVAASFMPSCSLPGPAAVPALPDIMQAQLRPFKLAQTPLASIAEAVLCSCGFHADAVGHPPLLALSQPNTCGSFSASKTRCLHMCQSSASSQPTQQQPQRPHYAGHKSSKARLWLV